MAVISQYLDTIGTNHLIQALKKWQSDRLGNYVTLNTAQTITGTKTFQASIKSNTSGADIEWGNIRILGAGSNGGSDSIRIGDDVTIGDCNVSGLFGMISTGADAGFRFFNSSRVSIGGIQSTNGTLQWFTGSELKNILHAGNSYIQGSTITINGSSITPLTSLPSHTHDGRYLRLDGSDTMAGVLKVKANQYNDGYEGAINMNNSNIYGLNSIYTSDKSDDQADGIHFWRDSTHVDTLRMMDGKLLFTPNRPLGGSGTEQTVLHTGNSSVSGGGNSWGSSITVKIGGTSKTLTIPGNPNTWRPIGTGSNDAAAGNHTHGLLHYDLVKTIENTTTDSGWSMINQNYKGGILKSLGTQGNAPDWIRGDYAAGIAFGSSDTKGVLSVAYNSAASGFRIAGGNGTKPVWWMNIHGTSGKDYNLDAFKTDIPSAIKNPNAIKFKDINGAEVSYDGSVAKDLTSGVYIAKLPYGFASFASSVTWGNTVGTSFASWNDASGGSIDFRKDNPSSGKMSIKVDGRVYVNEGTNPVLSASNSNGFWGIRTPDGNNDWVRTPDNGLIPYRSGGAGNGSSSLGTSSWYFSTAYIDRVYGSLKGNADSATNADTVDGYHSSSFLTKHTREGAYNIDHLTDFVTRDLQPKSEISIEGTKPYDGWGIVTVLKTDNGTAQLVFDGGSNFYFRSSYGSEHRYVTSAWKQVADLNSKVADSDKLDGLHSTSFAPYNGVKFGHFPDSNVWHQVLQFTTNWVGQVTFMYSPEECQRDYWGIFNINIKSNDIWFHGFNLSNIPEMKCVGDDANNWSVWVKGNAHKYDPYGTIQVLNFTNATIKSVGISKSQTNTPSGNYVESPTILSAGKVHNVTLWGQSFDGTNNVTGLITLGSGSHIGIKISNTYIDAIDQALIIHNNSGGIRFGNDAWDWNQWAGLKYVHERRLICLGIAEGSDFIANSNLSNGTIRLSGVATLQFHAEEAHIGHSSDYSDPWVGLFTNFKFGGVLAATHIYSNGGFHKNGSNDSYVLLGGGGHKAESSLSVAIARTLSGTYTHNGGQQPPKYFGRGRVGALMMNTPVNGNGHYKDWLLMDCYNSDDVGGGVAFGVNRQALGAYIMRSNADRESWAESAELVGTHNFRRIFRQFYPSGGSDVVDVNYPLWVLYAAEGSSLPGPPISYTGTNTSTGAIVQYNYETRWVPIVEGSEYCSFMLTLVDDANSRANVYNFIISTGYSSAEIHQLSTNDYSGVVRLHLMLKYSGTNWVLYLAASTTITDPTTGSTGGFTYGNNKYIAWIHVYMNKVLKGAPTLLTISDLCNKHRIPGTPASYGNSKPITPYFMNTTADPTSSHTYEKTGGWGHKMLSPCPIKGATSEKLEFRGSLGVNNMIVIDPNASIDIEPYNGFVVNWTTVIGQGRIKTGILSASRSKMNYLEVTESVTIDGILSGLRVNMVNLSEGQTAWLSGDNKYRILFRKVNMNTSSNKSSTLILDDTRSGRMFWVRNQTDYDFYIKPIDGTIIVEGRNYVHTADNALNLCSRGDGMMFIFFPGSGRVENVYYSVGIWEGFKHPRDW